MTDSRNHNEDERLPQKQDLPRILYLMGTGRSGTTIFEILLTNNPGVVGVGELTHIFKDGFSNNAVCACGMLVSSCSLWSGVRKRCGWKDDDIPGLRDLFEGMAWHSRFPRVAAGILSRNLKLRFRRVNECLFRSVSEETGASVVIDSSKYAGRALALARALPEQVYVICLTRSPAGLVAAFQKEDADEQKPKSLLATAAYYLYTLACFRVVWAILGGRVLHIRYENLVDQPTKTLGKIEAWSGIDLSCAVEKIEQKQYLEVGHIVTGNRLRRKGRVRFRSRVGFKEFKPTSILARPMVSFLALYRWLLGF